MYGFDSARRGRAQSGVELVQVEQVHDGSGLRADGALADTERARHFGQCHRWRRGRGTEARTEVLRQTKRWRSQFFTFLTDHAVPPTINASEQTLHPSVIFRKVTNGFRSL